MYIVLCIYMMESTVSICIDKGGCMDTWYDIAMKQVVELTWVYYCCSWDLCSKRFHKFCVNKYVESMKGVHLDIDCS